MATAFAQRAAFWVGAAWILVSPAWVQVLHRGDAVARPWKMYSGVGKNGCDARFYARTEAGDELVPRLATLHPRTPLYRISAKERRLELGEVRKVAKEICAAGGIGDLRADVRCAKSQGWETAMKREQNLCGVAN